MMVFLKCLALLGIFKHARTGCPLQIGLEVESQAKSSRTTTAISAATLTMLNKEI
jgi:hypothetical protein